jgi:hypothetical protein
LEKRPGCDGEDVTLILWSSDARTYYPMAAFTAAQLNTEVKRFEILQRPQIRTWIQDDAAAVVAAGEAAHAPVLSPEGAFVSVFGSDFVSVVVLSDEEPPAFEA